MHVEVTLLILSYLMELQMVLLLFISFFTIFLTTVTGLHDMDEYLQSQLILAVCYLFFQTSPLRAYCFIRRLWLPHNYFGKAERSSPKSSAGKMLV